MIRAQIVVTLKNSVLDPQGKAIKRALGALEFKDVDDVRQGKIFDITLDSNNKKKAKSDIEAMCEKLLANTVIEDYKVTIL